MEKLHKDAGEIFPSLIRSENGATHSIWVGPRGRKERAVSAACVALVGGVRGPESWMGRGHCRGAPRLSDGWQQECVSTSVVLEEIAALTRAGCGKGGFRCISALSPSG